MFGIGLTEMILVGLVILLLFSPRELPGMMKTVAKVYGSIRRTAEDFRAQVMEAEELREPIEEIRAAYHGTKQELLSAQELARRELGRARMEAMKAQQKLAELAREESRRDVKPSAHTPAISPAKPTTPAQPAAQPAQPAATPAQPVVSSLSSAPPAARPAPTLQGRVSVGEKLDDDDAPVGSGMPPAVPVYPAPPVTASPFPTPPVYPTPPVPTPPVAAPPVTATLSSPTRDRSDAA